MVSAGMKRILQLEGLAYFTASVLTFAHLHGSWILFVVLFFAPDFAFAGYLFGSKVGAWTYNALHSSFGPIVFTAFGWFFGEPMMLLIAIIWFAHVGFDRMLGYGLKYESGFKDTHLGKL